MRCTCESDTGYIGPCHGERDAEEHVPCPVCRAYICADANCPCEGDAGSAPVICCDGQEVCSEACRSTYEAGS